MKNYVARSPNDSVSDPKGCGSDVLESDDQRLLRIAPGIRYLIGVAVVVVVRPGFDGIRRNQKRRRRSDAGGLKTFFFVTDDVAKISRTVYPYQAIPAWSNIFKNLLSGHPQTLD
jgi:hypothetical protein